jgi:mono/diheme cytochrome c family protein
MIFLEAHLIVLLALLAACSDTKEPRIERTEIAGGKQLYDSHCAACHGDKLQGQPNWRERLPTGRLPAPPHDPSGHTWHHSDRLLFNITKNGIEPYAPAGYKSDMPAFRDRLSDDDIRAVLAYIRSTWPEDIRKQQAEVSRQETR